MGFLLVPGSTRRTNFNKITCSSQAFQLLVICVLAIERETPNEEDMGNPQCASAASYETGKTVVNARNGDIEGYHCGRCHFDDAVITAKITMCLSVCLSIVTRINDRLSMSLDCHNSPRAVSTTVTTSHCYSCALRFVKADKNDREAGRCFH